MAFGLQTRRTTCAVLALAMAAWSTIAFDPNPAIAVDADCGVHVLPSLDTSGASPHGELLAMTADGIYVGASDDAAGRQHATYWIGGVAHRVPIDLVDSGLLDVNDSHVAVGDGFDPTLDRWRGFVFDIDSGVVTWLPGIGGYWASARRINEHGVAVGDGGSPNGTAHPLRWDAPYTSAQRLPKVGGDGGHSGAWAVGINDHGDIVGSTVRGRLTPDRRDYGGVPAQEHWGDLDAIAWQPGPAGLEEAGPASHTWAVNNDGRSVGFADVDELQTTVAAYWSLDDGRLHLMGSVVPGMAQSYALGVSAGGWATGAVETIGIDEADRHAFVWTGSGDLLMLPGLAGAWTDNTSNAHGVDDARDEVVGMLTVDGISRPTVWRCASELGVAAGDAS
ncbi:hypothetical protein ACFPPE_16275 [Agromyces tardus]|uniref:hypothetical protein n=1 Tax=Agromyces tardus TaxID=2583849 RepID=UPI00110C603C|nr:hypothetical protein [Agromyces tardus]